MTKENNIFGRFPNVGKIVKVAVNKSPSPYTISFQLMSACFY